MRQAVFVDPGDIAGIAGALSVNKQCYVSPNLLQWTQTGTLMEMVILGGVAVMALAFATGSVAVIVMSAVVVLLAVGITGLIQAALSGIYAAALYRYASTGKPTPGFAPETLKLAFAPK